MYGSKQGEVQCDYIYKLYDNLIALPRDCLQTTKKSKV